MNVLDFTEVDLGYIITHHVGNKFRNEGFSLSNEMTSVNIETKNFLLKYFLLQLKSEELFNFSHPLDVSMNEMFVLADDIFSKASEFIEISKDIAKLLYENSVHPRIKEGNLNITLLYNINIDDEIVNAIGIFKSETRIPYLKMKSNGESFDINYEYGYDLKSVDKGCVIFNTSREEGYRVLILDSSSRTDEAQYWKNSFLQLNMTKNDFHLTNQVLGITKAFITKQMPNEFEISNAAKIDLLNRSFEYFKTNENFDKENFESLVLKEGNLIESFENFSENQKEKNNIELLDNFPISQKAVKKQARVFKKILKLDKNFQIHIHGDRDLIEQGVEKDGRKFYKLYYKDES